MELTPQAVAGAQFSSVRKGYDPDEVRAFLAKVARGISGLASAASAADVRAKTAEAEAARLREEALHAPPPAASGPDESEQISRMLILAQRTADAAVSEAQQEARSIVTAAEEKGRTAVADAESRAAEVLAAARAEAREAGELERVRVASEVATLERRRTELVAEVDRLSAEMASQRERLIAIVESLRSVLNHPGGARPAGDTPEQAPLEPPRMSLEPAASADAAPGAPAAAEGLAAPAPAEGRAPVPAAAETAEQSPPRPVDDDITGEFEPVSDTARDEMRDALADRFFDQGTFEDERWKPKT